MVFVPGDMDFPNLCEETSRPYQTITPLDVTTATIEGVKVGGIGGINSNFMDNLKEKALPYGTRHLAVYECSNKDYQRKLKLLWGVDVLITHTSPEECPELLEWIKESPVQMVIHRSAYDFSGKNGSWRGETEFYSIDGKTIIRVGPFRLPVYYYVVDISPGKLQARTLTAEIHTWKQSTIKQAPAIIIGKPQTVTTSQTPTPPILTGKPQVSAVITNNQQRDSASGNKPPGGSKRIL